MKTLFISRSLAKDSPIALFAENRKYLVHDQSLLELTALPFPEVLPPTDWIFFYSKQAVNFFFDGLAKANFQLDEKVKWACIGPGSAKALMKFIPEIDFVGEGQVDEVAKAFSHYAINQKVFFPRAVHSKKSIQQYLEGKIEVLDLPIYKNEPLTDFIVPTADVLIFTSPLNVQTYLQKYTITSQQICIAIGTTTKAFLEAQGISKVLLPAYPAEEAIADLIRFSYLTKVANNLTAFSKLRIYFSFLALFLSVQNPLGF